MFRNGDYISPQVTEVSGKFYNPDTGELLPNQNAYKSINDKVTTELQMSDEVVNKDLLRFYTPKGFKSIDPNDYQYLGSSGSSKQPKVQTTGAE